MLCIVQARARSFLELMCDSRTSVKQILQPITLSRSLQPTEKLRPLSQGGELGTEQ